MVRLELVIDEKNYWKENKNTEIFMNSDIKIHPIGKCQFFNQKQKRRKKKLHPKRLVSLVYNYDKN